MDPSEGGTEAQVEGRRDFFALLLADLMVNDPFSDVLQLAGDFESCPKDFDLLITLLDPEDMDFPLDDVVVRLEAMEDAT